MFDEDSKWEADAGNITNYSNFDKFVYRNGSVDAFLKVAGKRYIIAAKGMGKTLLLSYRRYLLEKSYTEGEHSSVIFIPSDHTYIAFIESIKTTLSKSHISKFENWEYCKRVWTAVIELSVLSYSEFDLQAFLNDLPPRSERHSKLLENLLQVPRSVEYIFNEIINMSESTLTQFIQETANSIGAAFCKINRSVYLFFDRFDNALETSHDSIWIPIQAGLLEAAWDVSRTNSHVKIYLSIRLEAYIAHSSRNKNSISSSVVTIKYSREELKELVNHLVAYYEKKPSIEAFLGFDTFPNTVTYQEENVFDFMFRYSIGRPRDFVQFCDQLSKAKDSLYSSYEDRRMLLKDKVRKTSSDTIIASLFEELRMLLCCLTTQARFNDFLSHLTHNILTYSEMKYLCGIFNRNDCIGNCSICSNEHHPFCDLYNMGLLGIVSLEDRIQHFKTPYDSFIHGLRNGIDYFLIHPSLREYINAIHMSTPVGKKYTMYKGILIGDSITWSEEYDKFFQLNQLINQLNDNETKVFFQKVFEDHLKGTETVSLLDKYNKIRHANYPIWEQRVIDSLIEYFTNHILISPKPISIFVSYAYDSPEHQERVISFVNMLREEMGFDAQMDTFLMEKYPDLDEMMTYGLKLDKVIIVLSQKYKEKADNSKGGVWKEFKMIAEDLEKHPQKYIFVSFDELADDTQGRISPKRIGNRWIVDLEKGRTDRFNELISFIKEERAYPFGNVNKYSVNVNIRPIKPF